MSQPSGFEAVAAAVREIAVAELPNSVRLDDVRLVAPSIEQLRAPFAIAIDVTELGPTDPFAEWPHRILDRIRANWSADELGVSLEIRACAEEEDG